MDEPDAPPRLLRRVLVWGVAAVILLPVLYVAASGPIAWWDWWNHSTSSLFDIYYRSLEPLHRSPQIAKPLHAYQKWWIARPAPRSWERANIVFRIERLKMDIENTYVAEQRWREQTARVESAMKRLRVLLNQPETQPRREEEIARIKAELEEEQQLANACQPVSAGQTRAVLEGQLQSAEAQLRLFDAQ